MQRAVGALSLTAALLLASCSLPSREAHPLDEDRPLVGALREAAAPHRSERRRDREVARAVATLAKRNGNGGPAEVDLEWIGRPGIDPSSFTRVVPVRRLSHRRWPGEWYSTEGAGSPLLLLRDPGPDRFVGALGEALPVTAVVEDGGARPRIRLYDLLDPGNSPSRLPGPGLARDYTAPLAYLLRRDDLMPEFRSVLRAGRYLDDLGLYRLDPYDPNKIPVVLIHGLKSNAQVWANLVNALNADPEIRNRYQFWTFSYPSGVPIIYSAMRLREELRSMRAFYDPSGSNPNLDRMVLVGHSLGGLLARLMISPSSDRLERLLPKRIDELELPPHLEALAREMLFFEPQSQVARTVFISTPHRGSEVAGLRVVRRMSGWIRVPRELRSAALTALRLNPELAIIPEETVSELNSVSDLRPDSLFMKAMGGDTIAPGFPYHSIISVRRILSDEAPEKRGDFLVRYPSAHLEGAESETVVIGSHEIFDDEETIAEVGRILKLHR